MASSSIADELLSQLDGPTVPTQRVVSTWKELSRRYRSLEGTPSDRELTPDHVRGYAVARAPATFAAVHEVLDEVRERRPAWKPRTVLDLGAGLGTGLWAAVDVFPTLERAQLVERSSKMMEVGKQIASTSSRATIRNATWTKTDVRHLEVTHADLLIAAYVVSELPTRDIFPVVNEWMSLTIGEIVVVDAGTPLGFGIVRGVREQFLQSGLTLTAPCPNDGQCPMTAFNWCHFSVRLHRTRGHRSAKSGALGYEDEKYSYVVGSRQEASHAAARVVRHPQRRSGHVRLELCHEEALKHVVVPKSQRAPHQWARRAHWGDAVPRILVDTLES